jgi:hypothetical protein
VEADPVIWIVRLRTGRVVIFQASGSKAFRAAALIASAAEEDLAAVIAAAVAVDLGVIDSVVAVDFAAAGLAASAVAAGSGVDDEN